MIATIDAYLDRLFDHLSGTGSRGRRVLIEAQAHLEEAVERAVAAGQPRADAERDAIRRFGTPEEIAHAHAQAGVLPVSATLGRIFAAGWLLAGVAGLTVALMGAIDAALAHFAGGAFVTDDPVDMTYTAARCHELGVSNGDAVACRAASIAHHMQELTLLPMLAGVAGAVLLVLFVLARRAPLLRALTHLPNAAMMSGVGAVGFGGVGLVLASYGMLGIAFGERVEVGAHLAEGLAAMTAGLVFLPEAWRQARTKS